MIIPCMKSTSACDRGGSVAFVDAGSLLLGLPGAPGCTTTGAAESVLCAWAGERERLVAALAASSVLHSTAVPLVELTLHLHQGPQTFGFGAKLNIFNSVACRKRRELTFASSRSFAFQTPTRHRQRTTPIIARRCSI